MFAGSRRATRAKDGGFVSPGVTGGQQISRFNVEEYERSGRNVSDRKLANEPSVFSHLVGGDAPPGVSRGELLASG